MEDISNSSPTFIDVLQPVTIAFRHPYRFLMWHAFLFQVWNLETMLPIQTLIRHEAAVLSVALQGDLLLSGSEDNDVKVIINLYC